MLRKTGTYVKRYDGQTKWMCFLIEDDHLLKNIIFGIKSAQILKKNLAANLSIIKSYGDEAADLKCLRQALIILVQQ